LCDLQAGSFGLLFKSFAVGTGILWGPTIGCTARSHMELSHSTLQMHLHSFSTWAFYYGLASMWN